MTTWHEIEPKAVWILRPGVTPLPAWPGVLVAWKHVDEQPPKPAHWQGLVAYARAGSVVELSWFYDSELRPVAEKPPTCGS